VIARLEPLLRPLLHALGPETAHQLTIGMLRLAPPLGAIRDDPQLAVRAFGLNFPNPIGMAAGFDKNAYVPDALLRLGFGFVEVGTITPLPQRGNPRPRVFRLESEAALINRLGFNSQGADVVLRRLARRASRSHPSFARERRTEQGNVGINIGANKDAADRVADYVRLIERFAPVSSYVVINVSSPNTPRLRDMQQAAVLDELLARVVEARERVARNAGPTPLLLKIAPDLSLADLDDIVGAARSRRIDGMIVGNTTTSRPLGLREAKAKEPGGLSGRPLFPLATRMLAETYVRVEGVFPLVGVGGIDSGASAVVKMRAGASLIQLYSALVFQGLGLIAEIKAAMLAALAGEQLDNLSELVGADAAMITGEPWPK
jgi:dihydroorotate dehydrogenase